MSGLTVLIVDDNPDVLILAHRALQLEGFDVVTADSGQTALSAAKKRKPDLILLDVMMPGMDGLQVLVELKKSRKTASIPVFMLTARDKVGDIEEAFELGASSYITKPFTPGELREELGRKWSELTQGGR